MAPRGRKRQLGQSMLESVPKERDTGGDTRPRHGARKKCSNPNNKPDGCGGWARRNSEPPACSSCGGGTRTSTKWKRDADSGEVTREKTGIVRIPPRVQQLLDGEINVDDLDEEELSRGYPRAADGSFRCPPNLVPRTLHNRMRRELFDRANRELSASLVDMAGFMVKVARDPNAPTKERMDAAKWVFERIMGKQPEVSVTFDTRKYETIFEGVDRTAAYEPPEAGPDDDGREA